MIRTTCLTLLTVLIWSVGGGAVAQIAGDNAFRPQIPSFRDLPAWDPEYEPPRTPDGKPDLQGIWSNASLTTLERGVSFGGGIQIDSLVIPADKVEAYVANSFYAQEYAKQGKASDVSDIFRDGDANRGYNAFWIDPGAEYAKVDDEWRSSWITTTENGRMPLSQEGQRARRDRIVRARSDPNTGPEVRTIGDRCLISYTGQAGPPLVNGMYNNHYQFVQTPSHVMINTEMNHDARVIEIDGDPRPEAVKQWFGDSVGRWEGDTLVVESRNLHPAQSVGGYVPLSPEGVVTERFTRVSDVELFYEFTVEDPVYYAEVWKGEMPLRLSNERIHEYACHEGNYALPGILRGDAMGLDTAIEASGE